MCERDASRRGRDSWPSGMWEWLADGSACRNKNALWGCRGQTREPHAESHGRARLGLGLFTDTGAPQMLFFQRVFANLVPPGMLGLGQGSLI